MRVEDCPDVFADDKKSTFTWVSLNKGASRRARRMIVGAMCAAILATNVYKNKSVGCTCLNNICTKDCTEKEPFPKEKSKFSM
ncbi:hypothetical protein GCM10027287_36870 [Bordetella muralis]